ncbi:hypothetical protein K439DRAFT_1632240 [Ramaria rubella]|nr:hypothetical protein K439DRAFT_1632240 [Ramaria rubella]
MPLTCWTFKFHLLVPCHLPPSALPTHLYQRTPMGGYSTPPHPGSCTSHLTHAHLLTSAGPRQPQ